MSWEQIFPSVYLWADSCNVYAIHGPSGETVIVDAGTGDWIDHVGELPGAPVALLCTHFFRDHSAGAGRAARDLGLPVLVPEREEALFSDPVEHFRGRNTYVSYTNYWDHFAPIESIPVASVLRDYERLVIAGLEIEVVPLPGATVNQIGIAFTIPGTTLRAVCSAETIHSPGRVPRIAPLQYNYNDLTGAVEVYFSASELRRRNLDVLLPSLGRPIWSDVDDALDRTRDSMVALCRGRTNESAMLMSEDLPELVRITDHVWQAANSSSSTWFVISEGGTALALDYGYHDKRGFSSLPLSVSYRKRPLLHAIDALKRQLGVTRIDVVIPSHFHDDHISGIPVLQRLFGTRCWVPETFADLLMAPHEHAFPCNWPVPIRVDRRIQNQEEVWWEGFRFEFAPMSGHTRFASLIGFEADGVRFAHTGDQYSFLAPETAEGHADDQLPISEIVRDPSRLKLGQNHVFRNGALLDGYSQSGRWLETWHPDLVISGHWAPIATNAAFFGLIARRSIDYENLHREAMPLGTDEVHFDLDSWGGWLTPYRVHLKPGEQARVRATVRNPLPTIATLDLELVGPFGWRGSTATLVASPREEVTCELTIIPSGECRRQPIAVQLRANGHQFGQIAEAIVSVGGSLW